jgi:hypothetical protein
VTRYFDKTFSVGVGSESYRDNFDATFRKASTSSDPMVALTLIQPWAWAIAVAGKRLENRSWRPPRKLWGQRIAIHAGLKFDEDSALALLAMGHTVPPGVGLGAIVATARVLGVVHREADGGMAVESCCEEPPTWAISKKSLEWFAGPFGWILDDVRVLREPVHCKGKQGLWTVPAEVKRQVLAQEAA